MDTNKITFVDELDASKDLVNMKLRVIRRWYNPYVKVVDMILIDEKMKVLKPIEMYHHLQSLGANRGRLAGLDVGSRYIGSAITDTLLERAEPLRHWDRKKQGDIAVRDELKNIIPQYNLSGFIIGYPTYMLRRVPMTLEVEKFVDGLDTSGKFPDFNVCYWNEFGSSKNAELMLQHLHLSRKVSKVIGDKLAAVGILQGYLDFHNNPGSKPWSGVRE